METPPVNNFPPVSKHQKETYCCISYERIKRNLVLIHFKNNFIWSLSLPTKPLKIPSPGFKNELIMGPKTGTFSTNPPIVAESFTQFLILMSQYILNQINALRKWKGGLIL